MSSFVIQSGIWQFFRDVNYVNAYGNGEGAPANYGPTALGPGRYGWVEQVGMANDSMSSIRMLAETPIVIWSGARRRESSNIDPMILLNQAGRNSHRDICDSLELFAETVAPEFPNHIPAHEAWKADVLAGADAPAGDRDGGVHGAVRGERGEGVGDGP